MSNQIKNKNNNKISYLQKVNISEEKQIGNIVLESGDVVYVPVKEADTKDIKAVNPGILELPEGGFMNMSVSELISHMVNLAKKIGRDKVSTALTNLERWNKNDNPNISKKARSVIDGYISKLEK